MVAYLCFTGLGAMPLVMDPTTGKYVMQMRKETPPPSKDQDAGASSSEEAESGGYGNYGMDAKLNALNKLKESMRERAEAAEAKVQELEREKRNAANNATKGMSETLMEKEKQNKDLRAQLVSCRNDTAAAIEDVPRQVEAALAAAQKEAEETIIGPMRLKLANAEEASKKLAAELKDTIAAHNDQVAVMKAANARELAKATAEQTQEIVELVGALNKRERLGKPKAGEGKSVKAARAAANKVVEKAQAQLESWEIANIGNKQIEQVHQVLELLEKTAEVCDVEVVKVAACSTPAQILKLALDSLQKVQSQAHAVLKELQDMRDQLYKQLYSTDNLLGHHYLKNCACLPSRKPTFSYCCENTDHVDSTCTDPISTMNPLEAAEGAAAPAATVDNSNSHTNSPAPPGKQVQGWGAVRKSTKGTRNSITPAADAGVLGVEASAPTGAGQPAADLGVAASTSTQSSRKGSKSSKTTAHKDKMGVADPSTNSHSDATC